MPRSGEETKTGGDGRREKKRRKKRKKKKKKKRMRASSGTESESDAADRRQTRDAERLTRAILEGDYRRVRRRSKRCKRSETINTRVGSDGYTPLHVAVLCRAVDACLQLLKCGANVDAVDAEGTTPLLHAVLLGDASVASLLVDRGADCSIRDKSGNGPYDFGLTDILRRHRANGVAKEAAREIRNFQRVRKMQEEYEWQQKLRMEDDAYQESVFSSTWDRYGTAAPQEGPIFADDRRRSRAKRRESREERKRKWGAYGVEPPSAPPPPYSERPKVRPRIGPNRRPASYKAEPQRPSVAAPPTLEDLAKLRRSYLDRWASFESRRSIVGSKAAFCANDVPFPPGPPSNLFCFPPLLSSDEERASRRRLVRQEYLRWHPDKFKQRYRGTFSGAPAEWDALLLRVASVAKSLSSMKLDALRL